MASVKFLRQTEFCMTFWLKHLGSESSECSKDRRSEAMPPHYENTEGPTGPTGEVKVRNFRRKPVWTVSHRGKVVKALSRSWLRVACWFWNLYPERGWGFQLVVNCCFGAFHHGWILDSFQMGDATCYSQSCFGPGLGEIQNIKWSILIGGSCLQLDPCNFLMRWANSNPWVGFWSPVTGHGLPEASLAIFLH